MKRILLAVSLTAVSLACVTLKHYDHAAAVASTGARPARDSCTTFDFHYLETQNVLYSSVVRHIEIFMDEKAFSEKNMRTLFTYLSKQNPAPIHLTVEVHTNWAQLDMPSDCPGSGASNMPADPHEYDFLQATYYRRKDREYFRYSPAPQNESVDFKTVNLKKD